MELFNELVGRLVRNHEPNWLRPDVKHCYPEPDDRKHSGSVTLVFTYTTESSGKYDCKKHAEMLMQKLCDVTEQVFGKPCRVTYYFGEQKFIPTQEIVTTFNKETT
jgi:hypothetical protein